MRERLETLADILFVPVLYIGIAIFGAPLAVLGAALAYFPGYRRWLVSGKGYLYLSLLPGLSHMKQNELRPVRLSLLTLSYLLVPSLPWWLLLWGAGTFVGSNALLNVGIYAVLGLTGLILFIRWLRKGWRRFNAEFEADTAYITQIYKKWSALLQFLWPKDPRILFFLYVLLIGCILAIFKLFGLYVTLIETALVCLPAYRSWLIDRPGYSYYLSRLPGLHVNEQQTSKLILPTLLYFLIPSLLGILIDQDVAVFLPHSPQDYGILILACLISLGLLHLWLILAWGKEKRLLDIRVLGEEPDRSWQALWKRRLLETSKRVWPYLGQLRGGFYVLFIISLLFYLLLSSFYFGILFTLVGVILAYVPAYRKWLTGQLGYKTRLAGLPDWNHLPGLTGLPAWMRKKPGLPGWEEPLSANRLALVTLLYLLLPLALSCYFWTAIILSHQPFKLIFEILFKGIFWATLSAISSSLQPFGYLLDAVLMAACWFALFGWFVRGWKVLDLMNAMTGSLIQQGKSKKESAEQLAIQACNLSLQYRGAEHITYAASQENLGLFYQAQGDYADAEEMLLEAATIAGKAIGVDHPRYAEYLITLAKLYHLQGRYGEASLRLREALQIMRNAFRTDLPTYAEGWRELAQLSHEMGNDADAVEQALNIRPGAIPSVNWQYATLLIDNAKLHMEKGEDRAARPLLGKVIQAKQIPDPVRAKALDAMGLLERRAGNYAEARTCLKQALDMLPGWLDPQAAECLINLGLLAQREGNHAEAGAYLKEALQIRESLGKLHPKTAESLNNLANLAAVMGQIDEALDYRSQAEDIIDHTIEQVFSANSESRRMLYQEILQCNLQIFLTLVVQKAQSSPMSQAEYNAKAFDLVARRKGIGVEALLLQSKAILLAAKQNPDLSKKVQEWYAIRAEIAQSTLAGPGKDRQAYYDYLQRLSARRQAVETDLFADIPGERRSFDFAHYLESVHHQAIAQALLPGTALVEFVRYTPFTFTSASVTPVQAGGHARYLAFVLLPEQAEHVHMIDVGDADDIDRLIADFRASIDIEGGDARNARPGYKSSTQGPFIHYGMRLREMIFDSLLPSLDSCRNLFLALDGDLTRLPFEVLPVGKNLHLIDDYHLCYLSTGRDILHLEESTQQLDLPLVIADPDYDLGVNALEAESAQADQQQPKGWKRGGGKLHFSRLPKTRVEGIQIGKILQVQPFLSQEALKGRLEQCRSPRILHIATHGYFLPAQPEQPAKRAFELWEIMGLENIIEPTRYKRRSRFEELSGRGVENPLLLSGLALAGANAVERGGNLPPLAGNGILSAEEVCGLSLQGTELVVLSACETGLGRVDDRSGEGVFGLRRAFVLAGARTLVMSLWNVPDVQTQQLMSNFYHLMRDPSPLGRAEALRRAQLELKSRHPQPYYWGAFICQGDPRPLQ